MAAIRNGVFCADHVCRAFVPGVTFYARVAVEKALPAVSDEAIKNEADHIEQAAMERLGQAVSPEDYDPSDLYQAAFDEGLEFYMMMRDARQGLINTFATGLYHLFEQQLCELYRLLVWDRNAVLDGKEAKKRLLDLGLDVTQFSGWAAIEELRLLANCIKHGEGTSCEQLAQSRPDLFERPTVGPRFRSPRPFVERPLGGEGVYFSVEEFQEKAALLERFWLELAETISEQSA